MVFDSVAIKKSITEKADFIGLKLIIAIWKIYLLRMNG
jgi:hypothetical protein